MAPSGATVQWELASMMLWSPRSIATPSYHFLFLFTNWTSLEPSGRRAVRSWVVVLSGQFACLTVHRRVTVLSAFGRTGTLLSFSSYLRDILLDGHAPTILAALEVEVLGVSAYISNRIVLRSLGCEMFLLRDWQHWLHSIALPLWRYNKLLACMQADRTIRSRAVPRLKQTFLNSPYRAKRSTGQWRLARISRPQTKVEHTTMVNDSNTAMLTRYLYPTAPKPSNMDAETVSIWSKTRWFMRRW